MSYTPGRWELHSASAVNPAEDAIENQSNAKAIAALPDLIEACRQALILLEARRIERSVAGVLRRALEKAEVKL